jgi:hypothetical protein
VLLCRIDGNGLILVCTGTHADLVNLSTLAVLKENRSYEFVRTGLPQVSHPDQKQCRLE